MRICFVSRRYFPAISGMSVYASNLLRELVRAGHEVTMISQYRGDAAGTRVYGGGPPPDVPGVRVIGLEALGEQHGGAFERDVAELRASIAAQHAEAPFDLLHAQYGYPTGLAAVEAGRDLGLPAVVSIQGGDGHWVGSCCGTHRRAMDAVMDHASALLIGSRSFAAEVHERLGTPRERFTIVPGAVDTDRFRPNGRPARDPILLYHGRVDRRKGALDLLDAMAAMRDRRGATRDRRGAARDRRGTALVMSGIGPDLDAVRARVGELGLGETVSLPGTVAYDDVPDVYHRGDVFVSPTYAEGFSNTILEAMASGLPVVSCNAVGVTDCLRDGDNGVLVEPGDVDGLTAALERVLADEALRERLAATALAEVRQRYAWRNVAQEIERVYAAVTDRPVAPAWTWDDRIEPCRFRAEPHLL